MQRLLCIAVLGCLVSFTARAADENLDPFGAPTEFKPGKKTMYAVWYADEYWHLATTSKDEKKKGKDDRVTFTGKVTVQGDKILGDIGKLEKAKDAKNADFVAVHRDLKGFDFQFATFGGKDVLKFKAGPNGKTITFKLLVDGKEEPKVVLIGKKGQQPEKAEFTLPARPVK